MAKVVGVVGGMGPEATAAFYQHLIKLTPASRDQDHLTAIIYSEPKIPDRTEHLVAGGPSPLPDLVRVARIVEAAGAELIAIPCNTAHYYWNAVSRSVSVPVLNIVDETVRCVKETLESGSRPEPPRVGILATSGTVRMGLYESALRREGLEVVPITEVLQSRVMSIIGAVKAGDSDSTTAPLLQSVVMKLEEDGADGIILGCTELGLAGGEGQFPIPLFDSLTILASATVRAALESG